MSGKILALAAAAAVLAQGSASAEVQSSFSSGVDYSSGDYGASVDTEVISVPLVVRIDSGPWAVRASTAYLEITGPADVADADGGTDGGGVVRSDSVRGFGDTNIAVSYTHRNIGGSDFYLEGTGRVRLPTGDDEKGLGVGETDYGLSGEVGLSQRSGGASFELTRRFLADHGMVEREDGWQVNLAAWIRHGPKSQIGVIGYWRESSTPGGADPAQLGGYFSYRINPNVRANLSVSGGLSDASPNYATGIRLTWRPSERE